MKKIISVCLILAVLFSLCACASEQKPAEVPCGHEAYSDLIARLEAKDFDGARSIIDILEGRETPVETVPTETEIPEIPVQAETMQPTEQPDSAVTVDMEIVELTKYNVNDYFEFRETYYISAQSQCIQYITLKDEYKDRLIALEDVKIEVSYLLCEAHGEADLKAEEFRPEYFEITSQEQEVRTLKPDSDGIGWINRMIYFKNGYFPEFAMDVEIMSGSGKLVLQ